MKTIVIIFGGRSVEHEISILTALHAAKHVESYRVRFVYLTRENRFLTGEILGDIDWHINASSSTIPAGRPKGTKPCWFSDGALWIKKWFGVQRIEVEAVLNCCHGGIGENGELAAMMAAVGVPIVSCDARSAMDAQSKFRTREILTAAGFAQPKFKVFSSIKEVPENLLETLGGKVIIKPDTLGSSIGITVAANVQELSAGLDLAFRLDKRVIVEEYIEKMREVNCSAFCGVDEVRVSACEVIEKDSAIFDFNKKYLEKTSGNVKKAVHSSEHEELSEVFEKVKEQTKQAYALFGFGGVVRADFMVTDSQIYLTEINTVPGFLAYHLWARAGMPYGVLIDSLVKQARMSFEKNTELNTIYKSKILEINRALVK